MVVGSEDIVVVADATSTRDDIEMAPVVALAVPSIKSEADPFLVTFAQPFDGTNPKDWPSGRKWAVTDVLSATGFNRIMVSTIMAPALPSIASELHMTTSESVMAMSIYLLATAFGPLLIGPLSEMYGRKRVLHASNIWFLVWNLACGFASTKELLIAGRFLAGFGASSIYALAGGVLGDVWRPEQRGGSLKYYLVIPLLGAAVGPIIGGFMAGRASWRWMFWATSIFQGVMIAVSFTVFRETYAPVILKKRAEKLRRDTGDSRYHTEMEAIMAEKKLSIWKIWATTLSRPLRLLATHPIIQVTALIEAFNYGLLYIVLSSFAHVWTSQYGESVEMSGLHYIACALGEVGGSQLGGKLLDYFYRRQAAAANQSGTLPEPEKRIPLMFLGAATGPLGLFIYGWAADYRVNWAVVDLGILLNMFFMQISGMVMQAYVIDCFSEGGGYHTSSALAASRFLESLAAFSFPLFTPAMYRAMGYGWGNTMLALLGLVIGVPIPTVLWKYGKRLREKAPTGF